MYGSKVRKTQSVAILQQLSQAIVKSMKILIAAEPLKLR